MEPIKRFNSKYYVTRNGRVFSEYLNNFMKLQTTHLGYKRLSIGKKHFKAHRLVAEVYLPNPKNLPNINHKNGIRGDNRVENLEWCNHEYNMQDRHIRSGYTKTREKVAKMLKTNKTMKQIASEANITYSSVKYIKKTYVTS